MTNSFFMLTLPALQSYGSLINISERFTSIATKYKSEKEKNSNEATLISWMKHDSQNIGYKIPLQSKNTGLEFNSLRAYLNIRPPFPIDNSIHNAIDIYLINLRANEIPTNISDIPTVKDIFPS